jgi:hypothetical protein
MFVSGIVFCIKRFRGIYRRLVLSPEGFKDDNIAPQYIPWSAVEGMSEIEVSFWGKRYRHAIEVNISREGWQGLSLTRAARSNKRAGSYAWVLSAGSETDFDNQLQAMRTYAKAHGGKTR